MQRGNFPGLIFKQRRLDAMITMINANRLAIRVEEH